MQIDKLKINNIADKIRKALDITTLPYEPSDAIKKLGGTITYNVNDYNVDAILKKTGENSFNINLNPNRHINRDRFTLAHELGHLFLHMGFIVDKEKWDSISTDDIIFFRDNNYSIKEYEANEFAASFLMPKDEFIEIAEENLTGNNYNLNSISEYFRVSVQATENRGKWLGIFKW